MSSRILSAFNRRIRRFKAKHVSKSPNPIKWGIIGLGYMAETFASAIDGSKDGIVYAVASRSKEKAARFGHRHNCKKTYGSYADMLNDESGNIDIIYIATPVFSHYDDIKSCLQNGYNVMCEKPICENASQLQELIDLAKGKNLFLMEGMWLKCLPTFQKAKEWESRIGEKELIKVEINKRENREKKAEGVLMDYGIYSIAFVESFLGANPEHITALKRINSKGLDTDWGICATCGSVNAFISISSSLASLSKAGIIGSDGTIEFESQFNRTNRISLYDKTGTIIDKCIFNYTYDGFEYEIAEVHKCLRLGLKESSLVSLEDSLNTLRLIDQVKNGQ